MSSHAEPDSGREGLSDPHALRSDSGEDSEDGFYRRFLAWAQRVHLERRLAISLLIAAMISGSATFAAMTGYLPRAGTPTYILLLLNLDLVLLLALGALVARRLVVFWMARKRGVAGARLHARITGLFAIVAVIPTIVVAAFSVILFDFGHSYLLPRKRSMSSSRIFFLRVLRLRPRSLAARSWFPRVALSESSISGLSISFSTRS